VGDSETGKEELEGESKIRTSLLPLSKKKWRAKS